ncbi:hypothetical protein AX760_16660 [Pararhizobium antarcticum]|uniref:Uncharacterized protein n=1 Tax=Pararhizobium antarcticum TaxID=1798805 RepID=A0A657LUN2_9HYPH|nr:hypothetical protein AX760_16660 [Pararhizobium antarcticum]
MAKCINGLLDAGLMIPIAVSETDAIDLYREALSETPIEGLRKMFFKMKRGGYSKHLAFLPNPSEMAAIANSEAQSLREDRGRISERARMVRENAQMKTMAGRHAPLKDIVTSATIRADELSRVGWYFVEKCPSQESWVNRAKKGLPTGSVFLWAIGEIWAPPSRPALQEPEIPNEGFETADQEHAA